MIIPFIVILLKNVESWMDFGLPVQVVHWLAPDVQQGIADLREQEAIPGNPSENADIYVSTNEMGMVNVIPKRQHASII